MGRSICLRQKIRLLFQFDSPSLTTSLSSARCLLLHHRSWEKEMLMNRQVWSRRRAIYPSREQIQLQSKLEAEGWAMEVESLSGRCRRLVYRATSGLKWFACWLVYFNEWYSSSLHRGVLWFSIKNQSKVRAKRNLFPSSIFRSDSGKIRVRSEIIYNV